MGENFRKLKNKALRIRLFKSISAAIGAGLATAGILRLLVNYKILALDFYVPIVMASGVAAAVWLLFFLLLAKNDMAFAKTLDRRFGLHERLQTMLQYRDETGFMLELQREDANKALESIPPKRLKNRFWWIYIIGILVGSAVLTASFFFAPAPVQDPVIPDVPYEVDDIKLDALRELIEDVEQSDMDSPYRESIVAELKNLLDLIPSVTTVAQKDTLVGNTIDKIYVLTDESSAAVELINALWSTDNTAAKELAMALNYYTWQTDGWKNFESDLKRFQSSLEHKDSTLESPDEDTMYKETLLLFSQLSDGITKSLINAKVPASDPLSLQLTRLATAKEEIGEGYDSQLYGLSTIANNTAFTTYQDLEGAMENTVNLLHPELFAALDGHATNTNTGEDTMTRLANIFGCALPQFERPNLYESGESSGGNNGGGNGGSIGGGDLIFGSDDLVLNPITGEYVTYGEILAEYNKLMLGKLENGTYTEEERKAIREYFDILYGGFKDKE